MTAYDDYIKDLTTRVPKSKSPDSLTGSGNYFSGFLSSALSSLPELIGVDATQTAEAFRREHPIGGVVSQVLPSMIPYAGWGYATTKLPMAVKALDAVEGLASNRILGGTLKESARFAPLEGARVATSYVAGDPENRHDVASQALFNTAAAGIGGAVIHGLQAVGKSLPLPPELSKEVDLRAPTPLKLRKMKEIAAQPGRDPKADAFHLNLFKDEVYFEHALPGDRYVGKLDTGNDGENLSRLFKSAEKGGDEGNVTGKRLHAADWKDRAALTTTLNQSGLAGKEEFIQFPRFIEINNENGVKHAKAIVNGLRKVGSDTWLAREADDGLYVVAKKIKGTGEEMAPKDQWVMFKTDQPEKFAPMGDQWTKKVIANNAWGGVAKYADTEYGQTLKASAEMTPLRNYNDIARFGTQKWLDHIKKELGVENAPRNSSARLMYDFAKEHVAPSKFQFTRSPRANYIFTQAKNLMTYADSLAHGIMYGEQAPEDGNIVRMVFQGARGTNVFKGRDAIEPLINQVWDNKDDVASLWRASNAAMDREAIDQEVIHGRMSPFASKLYKTLLDWDENRLAELQKTQETFGLKVTPAKAGHLGIARTWEGDSRVPIIEADSGLLVSLEGGKDRAGAIAKAEKLIEAGKKEGKNWKLGKSFTATYDQDLESIISANPHSADAMYGINLSSDDFRTAQALREAAFRGRGFSGERSGLKGYIGQTTPWTKDEFKKLIFSQIQKRERYMAEQNYLYSMQPDLLKLADEDPAMLRQLKQRFDDLAGRQSASSKIINETTDKLLAPYIGKNSATKVVGALNSVSYHNQLGMGNLMFPALNATTFLQTSIPHAAFVLNAPRESLAKYYSWLPLYGSDAKPAGTLGHVSIPKLLTQSFKELFKPDQTLLDHLSRGAREGVWAPRNVEEFVGENSQTITGLRQAYNGGLFNWLKAVSSFLPEASERFSRSHSFAMGHILGRDFLRLEGDQLYRFAKDFTENTMFGYSTADRARVITGPVGSLFGLYKNWQMHYLGWMMEYSGQAMKGNVKPLLAMLAGTGATGGVAALPIYGAMEGVNGLLSNNSLMQNIYETFGEDGTGAEHISDGVYYGLPGFLGLSLQGSAAAPGANPVRDAAMLFSFAQYDRAKAIGQAIGKAVDAYKTTGEHPVNSPAVRDAIVRAVAPRSLVRGMQSVEDGFIRSLNTGNPIASATPMQRFMYGLGFTPTAVDRQLKVADELWKDQNKLRTAVSSYGQAYFEAMAQGDGDAMQNLLMRAMGDGVPLDSIMKSANARRAKREEDQIERLGNTKKLMDMSAVYKRGL